MRKIRKEEVKVCSEGTVCPEQLWLYMGNVCSEKNKIGYIRLRFGILTLSPVEDGRFDVSETLYRKRFLFRGWKGSFDTQEERDKYVSKCIRKIIRWYNRKHRDDKEPL
jgi:hypothetical protein